MFITSTKVICKVVDGIKDKYLEKTDEVINSNEDCLEV